MTWVLSKEVYTPTAIHSGIAAFENLCSATVDVRESESILTIVDTERDLSSELLNYILTLSAQEILP